jgi:hypothetical protein
MQLLIPESTKPMGEPTLIKLITIECFEKMSE